MFPTATIAEMRQMLTEARAATDPYEKVLARFESEDTAVYGRVMPKWIPDYDLTFEIMQEALRPYVPENGQLLDLGAGTGRISLQLLDWFPDLHITLSDFSANMLSEVPRTLAAYPGQHETIIADFFDKDFEFGKARFDVIVSVFAIHHGRHPHQYQSLYNRIRRWLKPGGCFLCFDHVLGANDHLTALNMAGWANMIALHFDAATAELIVHQTYREDAPLTLTQHMAFLHEARFTAVDILWKKYIFAIYMAIKA